MHPPVAQHRAPLTPAQTNRERRLARFGLRDSLVLIVQVLPKKLTNLVVAMAACTALVEKKRPRWECWGLAAGRVQETHAA